MMKDIREEKWIQSIRETQECWDEECFWEMIEDIKVNAKERETVYAKRQQENWPQNLIMEIFGAEKVELTEGAEEIVSEVLDTLTPAENKALTLFYREGKNFEEIGIEMNMYFPRVNQVMAKALRKLRHPSRSKKLHRHISDMVSVDDETD